MPEKEPKKTDKPSADETAKTAEAKPLPVEDKQSVTQHTATIAGKQIAYTVTAGTYVLKEEDDKAKASIFYTRRSHR